MQTNRVYVLGYLPNIFFVLIISRFSIILGITLVKRSFIEDKMDRQSNISGYNATDAATILLKDYRERQQDFHVFDDYNRLRNNAQENIGILDEPLKTIAIRLYDITNNGFFLIQVCGWKIDYLAEALIHAIEAKNPLALANNTRALVEHLAALVMIIEKLEQLEKNLCGQGSEKTINDALVQAEKFVYRSFYGKSPKLTSDKNEQALHINDCLKILKKEVDNIEDVYDFLCEYVHPNYGSNLLVSTGQLGKGRLNPPEEFHRDILDRICRCCSHSMLFLKEHDIQFGSVFVRLQGLLELCFNQGAKVTSVFSFKTPKPEGDGKSRDTAFYFRNARTNMEAIKLCYEFLEKEGNEVRKRDIGGIVNGFIYDIYTTNKGTVWFKVPMV